MIFLANFPQLKSTKFIDVLLKIFLSKKKINVKNKDFIFGGSFEFTEYYARHNTTGDRVVIVK